MMRVGLIRQRRERERMSRRWRSEEEREKAEVSSAVRVGAVGNGGELQGPFGHLNQ